MRKTLPPSDLVLLGIGHTNAHIVRMWRMKAPPDARLICISDASRATYSGMLPGVLAGQYPRERMEIDLVRLCASAGARLIVDRVAGVDVARRRVLFEDRAEVRFDALAIGIGSQPNMGVAAAGESTILPIKPMQTFLNRLEEALAPWREGDVSTAPRVAIVGGGVGGVEIALCLRRGVQLLTGRDDAEITLIHADQRLASGLNPKASRLIQEELEQSGVEVCLGRRVTRAAEGQIEFEDREVVSFDRILWATSAVPPLLLERIDLPKDDRGFLLTDATLRTTHADAPIFVVGDSGTIAGLGLPKAGVYAVREGPVLWRNLQAVVRGQPLEAYRPQRTFLKLINCGNGRAVGDYRGVVLKNGLMWRLKDWIDGRFMDKYQKYEPMKPKPPSRAETEAALKKMHCAGCGSKVGASILSRALERLKVRANAHIVAGLEQPDDAALLRFAPGKTLAATVDFFTAPLDDPYLTGRIAALNSASDAFASNAAPQVALAAVTLPRGPERQQEHLLFQLLSGALREFEAMGAALAGGHTIEGDELAIGFTILGETADRPFVKHGLQEGDLLVATKPLGSGVLLAAHMRAACRWEWMESLLEVMLTSNQRAAEQLARLGVAAVTDVTGFGFCGHLLEMLRASGVAAEISLDGLVALPGAEALTEAGLESTLAPANRTVEAEVRASEAQRCAPRYKLLFDPQTSGGLLLGVSREALAEVLSALRSVSSSPPHVVGRVVAARDNAARVQIVDALPE